LKKKKWRWNNLRGQKPISGLTREKKGLRRGGRGPGHLSVRKRVEGEKEGGVLVYRCRSRCLEKREPASLLIEGGGQGLRSLEAAGVMFGLFLQGGG